MKRRYSAHMSKLMEKPIDELVSAAIAAESDEEYRDMTGALHLLGTQEVLDSVLPLCESDDADERALCADVLAQLGTPEMPFADIALPVLTRLLETDSDSSVLSSAAAAMGHLPVVDSRAICALVRLAKHPDAVVRKDVAYGLGGRHDDLAIHAIIELSRDPDRDVRDYATAFGLDSLTGPDTEDIRGALIERLQDEDTAVRSEALLGLAHRKDQRVLVPLKQEIERQCAALEVFDYILEAAYEMADPSLCPALTLFREREWPDLWYLEDAIKACCGTSELPQP